MRLELQREEEQAKRKGLAFKTIIGIFWLGMIFAAAYYFVGWLFDSGNLEPSFFWNQLFIPRVVTQDWLQILAAFVIAFMMNFFILVGYALSSGIGRTRPGTPTLHSRNPDPLDKKYNY
ncbi:MAG: hypothetical protein WAM60_09880 [Candidatus Promineifilaceae bacterium]